MIKKVGNILTYCLFLFFTCLIILEFTFRYQWIDFYQFEFQKLNSNSCLSANNCLIFGDSYSAYPNGYIEQLQDSISEYCLYNASISGTGIKQHQLFFEKRIEQTNPSLILYQFCVDNDFLDIKHPTNYKKINPLKNLFWEFSDHFLFLQYLNYKFAPLSTLNSEKSTTPQLNSFSVKQYNPRTKTNFIADPRHIEKTLFLEDEASEQYKEWKKGFEKLIHSKAGSTKLYLLAIPHPAQVSESYQKQMQLLGAGFNENIQVEQFPLYCQMQADFPDVKFLNPLNHFRTAEKQGIKLYFANDPHLNAEGQKVLANFILETIPTWK